MHVGLNPGYDWGDNRAAGESAWSSGRRNDRYIIGVPGAVTGTTAVRGALNRVTGWEG